MKRELEDNASFYDAEDQQAS